MMCNSKIMAMRTAPRFGLSIAEEVLLLPPSAGAELPPLEEGTIQYSLPEMREHFPQIVGNKGHDELVQTELSNYLAQVAFDGECWREVASGEPVRIEYEVADPPFVDDHLMIDFRVIDRHGELCKIDFNAELHVLAENWEVLGQAVGRFIDGHASVGITSEWFGLGKLLLYFFYEKDRSASARIVLNEELLNDKKYGNPKTPRDCRREESASTEPRT